MSYAPTMHVHSTVKNSINSLSPKILSIISLHRTSASQSNGANEAAVKIAKKCLKQEDPFLALMMHRSTPHSATGVSPAELLYGRKLRTTVPVLSSSLKPSWPDASLIREKDQHYKQTYTKNYKKHHEVRDFEQFNPNQDVQIKIHSHKQWQPAKIK